MYILHEVAITISEYFSSEDLDLYFHDDREEFEAFRDDYHAFFKSLEAIDNKVHELLSWVKLIDTGFLYLFNDDPLKPDEKKLNIMRKHIENQIWRVGQFLREVEPHISKFRKINRSLLFVNASQVGTLKETTFEVTASTLKGMLDDYEPYRETFRQQAAKIEPHFREDAIFSKLREEFYKIKAYGDYTSCFNPLNAVVKALNSLSEGK